MGRLQHYPLSDPDNNQLGGAQDGGGCQALASCFAHDKKNQHAAADLPHKRPLAAPQCAGKSALCSERNLLTSLHEINNFYKEVPIRQILL